MRLTCSGPQVAVKPSSVTCAGTGPVICFQDKGGLQKTRTDYQYNSTPSNINPSCAAFYSSARLHQALSRLPHPALVPCVDSQLTDLQGPARFSNSPSQAISASKDTASKPQTWRPDLPAGCAPWEARIARGHWPTPQPESGPTHSTVGAPHDLARLGLRSAAQLPEPPCCHSSHRRAQCSHFRLARLARFGREAARVSPTRSAGPPIPTSPPSE